VDVERFSTLAVFALVNYAFLSTVLLGVAWLITSTIADRHVRIAEQIWKGALVSSVAASLVQIAFAGAFVEMPGSMATTISTRIVTPGYAPETRVSLFIVAAWLSVALTGVARLVRAQRSLSTTLRSRRRLTPTEQERLVRTGLELGYPIAVCSAIDIPLVLGREICLPTWAVYELPASELNAVIAHEAAHLRRRDAHWRWATSLTARVLFFQPLNFVALARLRELAECICDDEAISGERSPTDLARALETFACVILTSRPHLLPSLASRESLTLRRVRRILTRASRSSSHGASAAALSTTVILLSGLSLVAPRIVPVLAPTIPYLVTATDPAGPFTLTVHRGRVIAATVNGQPVPMNQLRQRGQRLDLLVDGSSFTVELTPDGGIVWRPRSPSAAHLY
jgi:beta-lactamase regulating signal transducer with metallopeptidase domain